MSRRTAVLFAIAAVGVDVALLWPGTASASAPTAVGGWRIERASTPAGAVPTSPLTDDGTLPVRNSPAGVLAFSALRYAGDGGTLILDLAGEPATVPTVDACRITSSWTAGADQSWDSRPTYDCTHPAVAAVSGTQLRWQLDSTFANGATVQVALVPDPDDTTPYAVSFSLPTSASFQPNDDATTIAAPPPPAGIPQTSSGVAPPSGTVPVGGRLESPPAAAPVVASAPPAAAPQIAAAPAAATREAGHRAAGAGALAAFAFILLVRSFMTGGSRDRAARSLLIINREGA